MLSIITARLKNETFSVAKISSLYDPFTLNTGDPMYHRLRNLLCIALIMALPSLLAAAPEEGSNEPEIVIKQLEDKIVHEYRINGFLYAIKVIPKKGKPYYLVAEDGSDNFMRVDEPRFMVPKWEIITW